MLPDGLSFLQWVLGGGATSMLAVLILKKMGTVNITFNGKAKSNGGNPSLSVSGKTRGCLNISEEGLRKHAELKKMVALKMDEARHREICRGNLAELQIGFTKVLDEKLSTQKKDIVEAVKVLLVK